MGMMGFILWSGSRHARSIRRDLREAPDELAALVRECAERLGLKRRFEVRTTPHLRVPAVTGFFRPMVLFPAGLVEEFSKQQLADIIGHELAHVKRRDVQLGWPAAALVCLYWFHPAVWFAYLNVRREREMACDDEVLYATRQEGKRYASTLIRVAESFDDTVPAGAGFLGLMEVSENLLQRIRAAADGKRCRRFSRRSFAALIVFAALLLPMGVWPPAVSEAETSAGAAPANSEDSGQTVVTGRVTDAEGKPVAGARVTIRGWENGPELRAETRSDAEGRFTVDAKPGNCRLFAYAKGYASMYRTHDVSEGANPGWDFPLPKSAHVSGRVVDTKGKPAPGRVLELRTIDAGPPPGPGLSFHASGGQGEDRTDANGVFDMPSVAPGRHSIMVYSPSPLGGDRNMQQVPVKGSVLEVRSGDRVENFEIVVNPPEDFALSGHVRHADGTPMPGIGVDTFIPHGRHWWTKTDAQGAFRLEGLDGIGQSTFKVNFNDVSGAESFKLAILNVPLNATNVDLVVPGNGNIEGTVRNAKTGEAVTAYKVSVPVLRLPDSGAVWEQPRVENRQNPGGTFTITNVPAGEVTVEVEAAGLGAQRFTVPVEAGKTIPLACDLLGPAVFEGKTTMNGQPKGVGIIINGDWLNSDDGGNFRFDQYPNGDYVIWFFENDGWHRSADVHLKAGETTRLEMEMGGSCEVSGTVVFPKEEAFCTVRLSPKPAPDGWYEFGRPSPEEYVLAYSHARKPGEQYHLRGISPGRWYLMAGKYRPSMHRSLLAESREIELKDGESLTIDFDLTKGGESEQVSTAPSGTIAQSPRQVQKEASTASTQTPPAPAPSGTDAAAEVEEEIQAHYANADSEVQEYIRWTAKNFIRGGLWQPANAFDSLSPEERETKVQAAVQALSLGYGRHLCTALAAAGALKDPRLLPGLIQAAAYHREDSDYDCRPKWMAVSALGRQDDESAVPTLIPLVDHGNQNTRMWARASLARLTGQNFGDNKQAWGKWWNDAGKQPPIDLGQLKPWTPPG